MILPNGDIQHHGFKVSYLILKAVFTMGRVYSMIEFFFLLFWNPPRKVSEVTAVCEAYKHVSNVGQILATEQWLWFCRDKVLLNLTEI